MKFREVSKIPGRKHAKFKKRKICKNEKRLICFCNEGMAIAKIIDWEEDYSNAKVMYESLRSSLIRFKYLPVDIAIRDSEVYLIRTDME